MQTFNGTKFKIVIDKALIPMGGRVLKGSLKEALKGAKGAPTRIISFLDFILKLILIQ